MKHQLEPNTYTICESTTQCKELFEWAKANGVKIPYYSYQKEHIVISHFYDTYFEKDVLATYYGELTCAGETFIPLPEFISRLKGEWVESKTYTEDEVIDLLTAERTRAKDIAYDFHRKHQQEFEGYKAAKNSLAFVKEEKAETARYIGNAISGRNGLTPDSETIRDRIKKQLNNQ